MILERSDVQFPLWRKKVDRSLLQYGLTPIPLWVCRMWGIDEDFAGIASRSRPEARVAVRLAGTGGTREGWVTCLTKGRGSPLFRLFLDDTAKRWLRRAYPMTHLRTIETVIAGQSARNIDEEIPFWEFLDIEFSRHDRQFVLTDYYKQKPMFPCVGEKLLTDALLDGLMERSSSSDVEDITSEA